MPRFGFHPTQIFCSGDYTRSVPIVAIQPASKSGFQGARCGLRIEVSQENQRRNAAEAKAIAPIANSTRHARSRLCFAQREPEIT